MSDKMRPIPFKELLSQVIKEYKQRGTFFYVPFIKPDSRIKKVILSGKETESPIGPAAGPHTQLAQNILAAYAAGARYFELKTVQVLDGENLHIEKPCIYVKDEVYNTEWSTELTVYQALEEYIKAWFLLKLLIEEFKLGDFNGYIFNMSVGYNLEGIRSGKIDYFIESMKDAKDTEIFKACRKGAMENLGLFQVVTEEYVNNIAPRICDTITLSTMHGCPVSEIESIITYLMEEKKLNTYLKCNPTLLGADRVKKILTVMGYGYVTFDKEVFEQDISFETVVDLIKRLQLTGSKNRLEFGVKLTNTFPVKIQNRELPGEDMYMSGPALYPLTIGVAAKLSEALEGKVNISYSGGADGNNISAIYDTGIRPVTVSTLLLKPGGYQNLTKLNQILAENDTEQKHIIDIDKLKKLAGEAPGDKNYFKTDSQIRYKQNTDYSPYCSKCRNCIDVCPNRANVLFEDTDKKYILHQDALCNECGNCSYFCLFGHLPYKEKFTIFRSETDLYDSKNAGFYQEGQKLILRWGNQVYKEDTENSAPAPLDIINLIQDINRSKVR